MAKNNENVVAKGKRGLLRIVFSRTMLITLLLVMNFLLLYAFLFRFIQALPILFGSVVVFTAFMELLVLNGKDSVEAKLSWAVLIAVMPLFGAFLYLFVRLNLASRVNRGLINSAVLSSLPFTPQEPGLSERIKAEEPELAPIRETLELDRSSRVLFFSTEGATDREKYRAIVWDGTYHK